MVVNSSVSMKYTHAWLWSLTSERLLACPDSLRQGHVG